MNKYKSFIDRLESSCAKRNWKINKKKLNSDFDFCSIRINEKASKSICFSAGIHGNEPAGPEAVLKFIELAKVPDDTFVMLFPLVNPYGFDRGIRTNAFRQDINRRFCDKLLAGEAKAAYSMLKKHPVNLFCSLHEWQGRNGFYMYASDKIKQESLSEIPIIAKKWFELMNTKINNEQANNGIIWHPDKGYSDQRSKCTLENKMFGEKVHYICLETPSKANLEDRTTCQFHIMEHIISKVI